ncbi:MAG: cell division protein FtsZ [Alistipes sp.]|nr:cell division protein FtsZ [Rikenellaceae bacterium]MBR3793891.1 cell division protein FtsZ [Alistipes sp.]
MNDDVLNSLQAERSEASESHIMVVGVGGGGSNAVNFMRELHIQDVNYMVCNTDQQALDISPVELKVRLGASGEGAGNNPAEGRRAAIESLDVIKQSFQNYSTKMVFIAAAMGGGTGTGASPVIAKLAREMGILSVAIVTTPIRDEGPLRYQQALEGIEELRQSVDSLLIIDSDHIAKMALNMKFNDAMSLPDKVLASAAKGIAEIITIKSSRTNIDFADVSRVLRNRGRTHMGVGRAAGENRAEMAARSALNAPLLDSCSIRGARTILLNISCADSESLVYNELMTILKVIQSEAKYIDERGKLRIADIIWGNSEKADLGEDLEVIVVATNFAEVDPKAVVKEPATDEDTDGTADETENTDVNADESTDEIADDPTDEIATEQEQSEEQSDERKRPQITSRTVWEELKSIANRVISTVEEALGDQDDCKF